ncbi:hypothetical protein VTO42DRAFT_6472 [Malbranchea cinnamomea]
MNNAVPITWRMSCARTRAVHAPSVVPSTLLRSLSAEIQPPRMGRSLKPLFRRCLNSMVVDTSSRYAPSPLQVLSTPSRSFVTSSPRRAGNTTNDTPRQPSEDVPSLDDLRTFSAAEIVRIFKTSRVPVSTGNKALRALQSQRIDGTLDLDLPKDITSSVPQEALDNALEWLRANYPMDEDAAILRRIEREEIEEEQRLIRRAEELGLYKPQSGYFGAEKAKDDDVYGHSILQEIRKTNEKLNKQKEEEDRQKWLEGEAKERERLMQQMQKSTGLAKYDASSIVQAQPRADPNQRPALAWIQKHHIRATSTDFETAEKLTKSRRILPSLGIALLTAGLCCFYAEMYDPPLREKRMWPDTPPAAATAIGLIGVNAAIWLLWKIPPAWRMLNRYFISVPVYPYALSMVGSVFSHQQLRHLGVNMAILWFIGTNLHEEIGRGNFLALYTGTGVLASLTSLTAHVLTNNLTVTSLGASGAIAGLVAAWCMMHSNDKFTLGFLPDKYKETFSATGRNFLIAIVLVELVSLVTPLRVVAALDHWSHLGGYAAGAVVGSYWKEKREREKKRRREESFWGRYFGSS